MLWGHYSTTGVLTNVACSEHNQHSVPRYLRSDHVDNYTNLTRDHHNLSMFGDPFLSIPDPFIKQYYCYAIFTKEQPASAAGQIRSRCWLHHITHYHCCCCGAAPGFEWRPAACIAHSIAIACQTMNTFVVAEADQRPSLNIPPNMYRLALWWWPSQYIF